MSIVNCYEFLGMKPIKRNSLDLPSQMRMIIVSPSGGGKSQLVINMIDEIEKDFDQVIFVCVTINEPLYEALREKINNNDFLQFRTEMPDLEEIPPKSLLVLDDQVLQRDTKRTQSNYQNNLKLFVYGRKQNASKEHPVGTPCIYLTQNYSEIPQMIKKNSNVVIFKNVQASDLLCLKRDLELGSKEQAKAIFDLAKKDWVCIDKEEPVESKKRMFIFA